MIAKLIGVGVGPGDPDLITLKAHKAIQQAEVIAYLVNEEGRSRALNIAQDAVSEQSRHIAIPMTFKPGRVGVDERYKTGAEAVLEHVQAGREVLFLCEGDPLFYGSFIHLMNLMPESVGIEVIPGVGSIQAATAATVKPLVSVRDRLQVFAGVEDEAGLEQALAAGHSVAILKPGRKRPRILELLQQTGRTQDAVYVEELGSEHESIVTDMSTLPADPGPYFALFLVSRHG